MKRILIILPNLDLGGMETVVMSYFRHIDRSEIVFDFVVHGEAGFYEDEARSLGARIFCAPTRKQGLFKNLRAMRKIYAAKSVASDDVYFNARVVADGHSRTPAEKYDTVIVCTEHAFAFIELFIAWISGVKTRAAWSLFSDYQGASRLRRRAHFFARPFMRLFTNLFLACTTDAGVWLFGKKFAKNLHKPQFHIINNASDLDIFSFSSETREKIRKTHGLESEFVIGIAGRLTRVKNHAFALEVFAKIPENAVLLVVGDGELRGELEAKARELGIDGRVIFTGRVESVAEYFQALDLLLVPSFHEGLPLIAIEAQAASLPIIISDTITRDVKICGLAQFEKLDAAAWAEKISQIKNAPRERGPIDLKNSGYDIRNEAPRLQKILLKEV